MRASCAGLLFLAATLCSGEFLTVSQQGSAFPGLPETVVLDEPRGDVRFVGLVQQYDLSSRDDTARQSLTVWPTSSAFLDGGWQSWVEQQLSAFDSLKELLVPRGPCPHASAMATPPQSDYPSLLSYMATSRFGPSILTAYARQVDQDLQPGAFSMAVYSESAEDGDLDADFLDGDVEANAVLDEAWQPGSSAMDRFRNLNDNPWFGRQEESEQTAEASISADEDSELAEPLFRSSAFNQQFDGPVWDPAAFQGEQPDAKGELEWGETCNFLLFIILCIGCVAVWVGLMRAWVSCCRLEQQTKAAKIQQFGPNPLLAPLIPEGATRNPAFSEVEVAAEHPPQGTHFAPRGSEFVSIAYMPLQSETQART